MTKKTEQSRYLEYLPAIYHKDPTRPEGSFLGEFLLPFEEVLTGFEDLLSVIDQYFAPALTTRDFLPWLANWVALVLDENWEEAKQRRLISEAVELYRRRGMVTGLKRYLEIYNDRLTPDIREGRWPGGMQIGVASQIGGLTPEDVALARIERADRRHPPVTYDYYVVDTVAPAGHPHVPEGQPLRLYYRADRVKSVKVGGETGEKYVRIQLLDGGIRRYEPATVMRRDGLINERYTLTLEGETETETVNYRGGTFLINEVELPYRFTVNIRVPCEDWEEARQPDNVRAIRTIIDEVKPAHTLYYLKLTPVSEYALWPMQIGVRSTIDLDTTIG